MNNEELIDLLFTEDDRLSRPAVNEIVRRADELMPDLASITMDRLLWTAEPPDWWATVHASYVLGAIGTEEAITPLKSALRWSDAYDNEWVTEDLPSIFGHMGKVARGALETMVADRSAGWSARAIAMDGLAAVAVHHPEIEEEIVRMIAAILDDGHEEPGARRSAATILLDFRRADCEEALVAFAREEEGRFKDDGSGRGMLTIKEVEKGLAVSQRDLSFYQRDWMKFYDPKEIRVRQERWAEEREKRRLRLQARPGESLHDRPKADDGVYVGLEDPCPCGSGKKYRRCCWQKLH
jgi:hypothetical protein